MFVLLSQRYIIIIIAIVPRYLLIYIHNLLYNNIERYVIFISIKRTRWILINYYVLNTGQMEII